MKILGINIPSTADNHKPAWGPNQQDALCKLAESFKHRGDEIGLHLVAAADLEMKRCQEAGRCPALGIFLVDIALCHNARCSHEMAHMLAPELHDLLLDGVESGKQKRDLDDLKRDAGID